MRLVFIFIGVAFLGACSHMSELPELPSLPLFASKERPPEPKPSTDTPAQAVAATQRDHVRIAIDYLESGKVAEARAELQQALALTPENPTAASLLRQIDSDPVSLLGSATADYTVQPGDTMSTLAARFLGDPMMFYALSRYNGLSAPRALAAGRKLKVPARPDLAPKETAPPEVQAPIETVAIKSDPVKANAARLSALEKLNTGDVNGAVVLLREAQKLDADDAAIGKDLERALRIQAALGG